MGKVLFGILVTMASFMMVESLTCNNCSHGIFGFCLSLSEETCANGSLCSTAKATFPTLSSSVGFNTQGCLESDKCNITSSANLTALGFNYQVVTECCSTDKCNPTTLSGTPSTKMTFTSTVGAVVLASMLGSML